MNQIRTINYIIFALIFLLFLYLAIKFSPFYWLAILLEIAIFLCWLLKKERARDQKIIKPVIFHMDTWMYFFLFASILTFIYGFTKEKLYFVLTVIFFIIFLILYLIKKKKS